MIESINNKL